MKAIKLIIISLLLVLTTMQVMSQNRLIKGYVFNSADGSPVYLAAVQILNMERVVFTDESGYFIINQLTAGTYTLKVNSLGYNPYQEEVKIEGSNEQLLIKIDPSTIQIKEVKVSGERQRYSRMNMIGAYQLNAATISKVPSIGGQSDLAQFLQGIPGIKFTGDRGGQFYIRGGAPVYNKITLDGLTVISPFHSIGFMSVFDTDIISVANVYTAGFNAQYSGRLSSIIDLKTRDGNRTRMEGKIGANTFGYDLLIHGPIIKMKPEDSRSVSYLFNYKGSYIDKIAPKIYPYLDSLGLPYKYGDFYGKISTVGRKGDQLSFFGHHFSDQANFSNLLNTSWVSNSIGSKLVLTPAGSEYLLTAYIGYSDFYGNIYEANKTPRETRYNNFQANIGSGAYLKKTEFKWALEISGISTNYTFVDLNDVVSRETSYTTDLNVYGQLKKTFKKCILEPGINVHYFSSQGYIAFEPRLQFKYNFNPILSFNFATGLYAQDLFSTVSEQDITNLFQGYYTGTDLIQTQFKGSDISNSIQKAWHGVAGLTTFFPNNLKLTAEIYAKDFYRLVNYNRNKIYEDTKANKEVIDYLKKYFIIEKGWSYGLDLLVDYQNDWFSLWLGYSLGFASRQDEFSTFTPHFDRRHNINLLVNYIPIKNVSIKARWNVSSGYPFTQNMGLYEEMKLDYGTLIQSLTSGGNLSVLYGPYNEGRLPWYHRLDISAHWIIKITKTVSIELNAGVMNAYNRQNVFYLDRVTGKRVDQLPILPNAGMVVRF